MSVGAQHKARYIAQVEPSVGSAHLQDLLLCDAHQPLAPRLHLTAQRVQPRLRAREMAGVGAIRDNAACAHGWQQPWASASQPARPGIVTCTGCFNGAGMGPKYQTSPASTRPNPHYTSPLSPAGRGLPHPLPPQTAAAASPSDAAGPAHPTRAARPLDGRQGGGPGRHFEQEAMCDWVLHVQPCPWGAHDCKPSIQPRARTCSKHL